MLRFSNLLFLLAESFTGTLSDYALIFASSSDPTATFSSFEKIFSGATVSFSD